MSVLSILVSALVAFIIGFLFHGPVLGKIWMELANIHPTGNEKLSDMWKQMLGNYFANVVMAFVISGTLLLVSTSSYMGEMNAYRGAICAAWLWLGFVVTNSSLEVLWMGRNYKLWLFECVSSLVATSAMGAVLGGW